LFKRDLCTRSGAGFGVCVGYSGFSLPPHPHPDRLIYSSGSTGSDRACADAQNEIAGIIVFMQIIWNVNTLPPSTTSVVSLGTFDGVHLGHQTILDEVKKRAHKLHSKATMVTFEPHPQLVLNNPS